MVLLSPKAEHGYVREWVLYEGGPERHEAYALQWFSMAAALVIIYVAVNLRRQENSQILQVSLIIFRRSLY